MSLHAFPDRVNFQARLVSGGMQQLSDRLEDLAMLRQLQVRGLDGKRHIHSLFTDDWAAPPLFVEITGVVAGKRLREVIPYD